MISIKTTKRAAISSEQKLNGEISFSFGFLLIKSGITIIYIKLLNIIFARDRQ